MKNSLFGYKKAEVNARITELQETIKMNESRIASLEDKCVQAQKTLQEKNIALDNMSNELNRYIIQSTQAEKTENAGGDRSLANVGEIYMLAYDSASTIIKSAQTNVEDFMDKVFSQSESAEEQTKKVLANMQRMKADLQNMVVSITEKTRDLQDEISALIMQTSNSLLSFKNFDTVREDVKKNIDAQMYECLQKSKRLLRHDYAFEEPVPKSPPPAEAPLRRAYEPLTATREDISLIRKIPDRLPGIQGAYGETKKFYAEKFGNVE